MSAVKEIIRTESNGALSFGDYTLDSKTKVEDYAVGANLYKVKTYKELTKLERDGLFVYESEPGTAVTDFAAIDDGVTFTVSGDKDAMITVGLAEDTEYNVTVGDKTVGVIKTNLGGKLSISVELEQKGEVAVVIRK